MPSSPPPLRNRLLAGLSAADLDLLRPALEPAPLKLRLVVERPRRPVEHIYFPESGFISIVARSHGDRLIEVGLVGREGMTGVSVVLGDDRATNESFVQAEGSAFRIAAEPLRNAMRASASLRERLLRYTHLFLCQTAQTALSNGQAHIEERLARWLLMARDRLDSDEMWLTHEFLAMMLGVRRPGVTVAMHFLEGKLLIRTGRGVITIVDREGLEETANGSYGVPEAEYARVFGT